MNLEHAKQEFTKYVNNYDQKNEKINRKYWHSLRVMENAEKIAKKLQLTPEQIELAKLIGLLHDIGRFEQAKIYNNFRDHETIDHGDIGAQILRESNYIRKYIEDDKYDNIILKVVKNHNKLKIEEGLSEEELLFTKIVRDADKLDIFYEGTEIFWNTEEEREKINNSVITPEIWETFKSKKLVDRAKTITPADGIINFVSFIFDINFEYTYEEIKKQDYINKIIDRFNFKNTETAKQMEEVRKV